MAQDFFHQQYVDLNIRGGPFPVTVANEGLFFLDSFAFSDVRRDHPGGNPGILGPGGDTQHIQCIPHAQCLIKC